MLRMTRINYSTAEAFNVTHKIKELNEKIDFIYGQSRLSDKELKRQKAHNKTLNQVYEKLFYDTTSKSKCRREWYFLEDSKASDTKLGISKDFNSRKSQHISDQKHKQMFSLIPWTPCDSKEFHNWIPEDMDPFKFERLMRLVFEKINNDYHRQSTTFEVKVNGSNEWYRGNLISSEDMKDLFNKLSICPSCFLDYLYDDSGREDVRPTPVQECVLKGYGEDLLDIINHYGISFDEYQMEKKHKPKYKHLDWMPEWKKEYYKQKTIQAYEIKLFQINQIKSSFSKSAERFIMDYYKERL